MQSPWPSLEVALGLHCLLQHVCMQHFFARPSLVWCSMLECHMFTRYAVQHAMTCSAALLGIDTQQRHVPHRAMAWPWRKTSLDTEGDQTCTTFQSICYAVLRYAVLCCPVIRGHPLTPGLLQNPDKESRHDAGLPVCHAVSGFHGQRLHCGGPLLLDLRHHGGAAVWRPLLDMQ